MVRRGRSAYCPHERFGGRQSGPFPRGAEVRPGAGFQGSRTRVKYGAPPPVIVAKRKFDKDEEMAIRNLMKICGYNRETAIWRLEHGMP
ncbi:hypothetical protein IBTHAUMO2_780022 [Nitrosopumilaceae archaeon]|nr:hypothetical protein IBTHAUMO2_780022 [Nitrosopumilaceae archaeon]